MIDIQHLTLKVPHKILLEDFSTSIYSSEKIGIFGPNGAGKSTFLKGLMGLFPCASGTILFDNHPINKKHCKIAYLPQDWDPLSVDYSVMGFMELSLRGNHWGIPWSSKKDRIRCENALKQVDALSLKNKLIKKLSGGERKRILLATLLLDSPEVVLLDEPLANLDPRYQNELLSLIESLQKEYRFTLFITAHDFNPLLYLLDRVMFIGQGKAILDQPEKVIQSHVLSELYQTPLEVIEWNNRRWVLSNEQEVFLHPGEHCHGIHCAEDVRS